MRKLCGRIILGMASLMPLVPVSGQSPAPAAGDHEAVLVRIRKAALGYADSLQDFICTQVMTRSTDASGSGKHWKTLETQELDLGYINHKERYRLLKVNGKTTDVEKRVKQGYFRPGGEFGSTLLYAFSPRAAAEFSWDHESSEGGRPLCTFRYHVPVTTSLYEIQADADHVRMAYDGTVTADCETGDVLQLHFETEPATVRRGKSDLAIGNRIDLRYGVTAIGEKSFLLPVDATSIAPFGPRLTKSEISFSNYRKYDSSSKITFDDGQ